MYSDSEVLIFCGLGMIRFVVQLYCLFSSVSDGLEIFLVTWAGFSLYIYARRVISPASGLEVLDSTTPARSISVHSAFSTLISRHLVR